jgi:NADPH2:quinone reductase
MTMRAWQVDGTGEPSEVLRLVDVEVPEPGPGQLRVRVRAAGLGLPDVFMCRGTYPLTPPLPFTPGQEVVGEVTATGPGVDVAVGTLVMGVTAFTVGRGGFAEEALLFAPSTFPVPAGLDEAEAAGFWIPYHTGWIGLVDRGHVAAGERLLVLGAAGGSGLAAVQLGRALGAHVVAVVGDDAKAELCRSVGAHEVVDHRNGPVAEQLDAKVDVVYDPVGGAAAADAFNALAPGGRLLLVGFASGEWPVIDAHRVVVSNTALVGVFAGGYSRQQLDEMHRRLSALVHAGEIRPTVSVRAPFDELPTALDRLATRAAVGKSVLLGT